MYVRLGLARRAAPPSNFRPLAPLPEQRPDRAQPPDPRNGEFRAERRTVVVATHVTLAHQATVGPAETLRLTNAGERAHECVQRPRRAGVRCVRPPSRSPPSRSPTPPGSAASQRDRLVLPFRAVPSVTLSPPDLAPLRSKPPAPDRHGRGARAATGRPEPEPEGRDAEGRRESSTIGGNDGPSD